MTTIDFSKSRIDIETMRKFIEKTKGFYIKPMHYDPFTYDYSGSMNFDGMFKEYTKQKPFEKFKPIAGDVLFEVKAKNFEHKKAVVRRLFELGFFENTYCIPGITMHESNAKAIYVQAYVFGTIGNESQPHTSFEFAIREKVENRFNNVTLDMLYDPDFLELLRCREKFDLDVNGTKVHFEITDRKLDLKGEYTVEQLQAIQNKFAKFEKFYK